MLSIASCEQYVFKRDFTTKKWVSVDPDGKACTVLFIRRDGDYFMQIVIQGGKRSEYAISRDNKLHYSAEGFVQIPLADIKELYGIKFRVPADGEEFYAKIVHNMDLDWSAPRTTLGSDNLPNPAVNFGPPPAQSMPAIGSQGEGQAAGGPLGMAQNYPVNRAGIAPSTMSPNMGIAIPPSMQNRQYQHDLVQQRQTPSVTYPPQDNMMKSHLPSPLAPLAQQGPGYYQQGPSYNQQGVGYDPQEGGCVNMQYHTQYVEQAGNSVPRQPDMPQGGQQQSFQSKQVPYIPPKQQHQNPPSNPAPRKQKMPEPIPDEFQSTVAQSLMNAINTGNLENAQHLLGNVLGSKINLKIEVEVNKKPSPHVKDFMLDVLVEFRQPQKESMPIFLDQIYETDTVFDLQIKVENKFFIPRSSQNWIMGKKLIKGEEDLKKPLSDHGLVYVDGCSSVKCFLYVMHTKKAGVAKEDYDAIQIRRREQQKRLQQNQQAGNSEGEFPQEQPINVGPPPTREPKFRGQDQLSSGYQGNLQGNLQNIQGNMQGYHGNPQGNQGNIRGYQGNNQGNRGYQDNIQGHLGDMRVHQGDPQGHPGNMRGHQGDPQCHPGNMRVHQGDPQGHPGNMRGHQGDPQANLGNMRGYQDNQQGNMRGYQDNQQGNMRGYQDNQQGNIRGGYQDNQQGNVRGYQDNQQGNMRGYPAQGVFDQIQSSATPRNIPTQGGLFQAPNIPRGARIQEDSSFPPQEQEPVGWECPTCTFINVPTRPGCEQCGTAPPDNYVVPDNAPLDSLQLSAQKNDQLFEEYEKSEKQRKAGEAMKNYQALIETEDAQVVLNREEFECLICYMPTAPGDGIILRECLHQFCKECLHDTIINGLTAVVNCPFDDGTYTCAMTITEREMRAVLSDEELETVFRRGLREAENASANSFHCKTADCRGFCFYEDDVNEFQCPVCTKRNCLLCKAIHEGMDCKEYQDDLKRRAANDEAAQATQNMLEELVKNGEAMNCPKCKIIVQKKDGCDWIRCSMCRTEICWATKGPRWGPQGTGDNTGGCLCRINGKKCHPLCRNCH